MSTIRKIIGAITIAFLLGVFALQVQSVSAHKDDKGKKPLTSPISSPCKPGHGWGDKNHCHFGIPGHQDNDDHGSRGHEASRSGK